MVNSQSISMYYSISLQIKVKELVVIKESVYPWVNHLMLRYRPMYDLKYKEITCLESQNQTSKLYII